MKLFQAGRASLCHEEVDKAQGREREREGGRAREGGREGEGERERQRQRERVYDKQRGEATM